MSQRIARSLLSLPRPAKQAVAVVLDALFCVLATALALVLRLETIFIFDRGFWLLVSFSWFVALPLLAVFGAYRAIFRYSGEWALAKIAQAIGLYGLIFFSVVGVLNLMDAPRSIGLVQPVLLLGLVGLSRWFARRWLGERLPLKGGALRRRRVIIYGAGDAGRQLAEAFGRSQGLDIKGFVDDAQELWGRSINGLMVYPPSELASLADSRQVTDVWLALPSLSGRKRQQVIDSLRPLSVHVRTLPSIRDLTSGRVSLSDLRELDLDELLAREPVEPKPDLLLKDVHDKTVLVTGAGGSIGSELCRQLTRLGVRQLVLFEQSEYALYQIYQELERNRESSGSEVGLIPVLGSVTDRHGLRRVLGQYPTHTVFHAAAYKHVPLVESNPLAGLHNNVFGTLHTAQLAIEMGVKSFVLVSTDKAVRPTNVMGATKRLAELCVQALSAKHTQPGRTKLSMVRFGNVLGSSGSVVPLFRQQVSEGGPVTLTHINVTRYFMSIPEAAQLVIQAGALSEGGEVFVLDMGSPVRIYDLAERVIELSGRTVRSAERPDGDIEIQVVGLRPGEKLYEELLIGDNPMPTAHRKIMQAQEKFIPWERLEVELSILLQRIQAQDASGAVARLHALVPEYVPEMAGNGASEGGSPDLSSDFRTKVI